MFVAEETKVRIVVADDSVLVRRRLVGLLQEIAEVEIVGEAQDGTQALLVVSDLHPDVLILDIQMPGVTGLEVLRRVQKRPEPPQVIVVTNYAFPQYRQKCLEAGALYFFDKSVDFDKIPEAVRQLRNDLGAHYHPASLPNKRFMN